MLNEELDTPATRRDLAALGERFERRFEQIDRRFEQTDTRFEQIDRRFEEMDTRFEQIDRRFEQMDTRFEQIDRRFEQMDTRFDEVKHHFDVVAESFKSDFANLFDWTKTTTSGLTERVNRLEQDHGGRLTSVELRLTRLEQQRK